MASDPAFLFYPGDWLGGTLGMTFEQKGAYLDLLMLQFNRGHMTSHMIGQVLGQNGGQNGGQIWDVIKDKFKVDAGGLFYNSRLEEEKNKRKAFTESRINNISGKNQYSKPVKKSGHKKGHMTSHMEDVNENTNEDIIGVINTIAEKSFFEIALDNFYEMRIKKKKPATDYAKKLILMELEKLAPENEDLKIDIINQSTKNSWTDVFPLTEKTLKQKSNGTSKPGNAGFNFDKP